MDFDVRVSPTEDWTEKPARRCSVPVEHTRLREKERPGTGGRELRALLLHCGDAVQDVRARWRGNKFDQLPGIENLDSGHDHQVDRVFDGVQRNRRDEVAVAGTDTRAE
ncbi:hypothetical protein [Nocardia sp. NBC_00511]|uniref:hypothetical protein n=1 Tax=Nocardia sp. NBC_00511 TaxID=2903591 RepID=UPI002F90671A